MGEDGVRVKRLGLAGMGAWGRRYADTISRRQDCTVAAFARASERQDGAPPGARRCRAWQDLVALAVAGELDGLIVATTPASQAEIAAAAIQAGVPVLVEKPLGLSAGDAEEVLRAFLRAPRQPWVVVDYIHLWSPAYRTLRALIGEGPGGTGAITGIDSAGCNRGPFRTWSSLYDYGPHDLALCLDLLGTGAPFHAITAHQSAATPHPGGGELFDARFTLGAVPIAMRVGNGAPEKMRRFAVTLAGGRQLIYDDLRPHPFKLTDRGAPVAVDTAAPLDAVLTDFLAGVGGTPPATGRAGTACLELSVKILQVLDAIGAGAARGS